MKYYSEELKKVFDTEKELIKAEKENEEKLAVVKAKREERASRAKEVEEAYKKYLELRAEFVKDYGSWHSTITSEDLPALKDNLSLFDLFDKF